MKPNVIIDKESMVRNKYDNFKILILIRKP